MPCNPHSGRQKADFIGLTLKEYFEKTERRRPLNRIEEEESESELEYR
jgi:hypothetical protein